MRQLKLWRVEVAVFTMDGTVSGPIILSTYQLKTLFNCQGSQPLL
jgi:hypothetical protein